jgi:site-specific DNA-cytosine methylase
VRREWWRYPQEAHILDPVGGKYRRLAAAEIGTLQGFPGGWGTEADLDDLVLIRGFGDAVPPALAEALFSVLREVLGGGSLCGVEVCAGFGGLALGASRGAQIEHVALIERWSPACDVLRRHGPWSPERVVEGDVREFKWESVRGEIDVLSGGPPCQPWSIAGKGMAQLDERDLLGYSPALVEAAKPRAFLFENVPGLLAGENSEYASWLIRQLRQSGGRNEYAVTAAVLNAADFGVPQVRRRVFIVGLHRQSGVDVREFFDRVWARRTHGDPRRVLESGLVPWRRVQEALPEWNEWNNSSQVWRRWILAADSPVAGRGFQSGDEKPVKHRDDQVDRRPGRRIQLTWPSKGCAVAWADGAWEVLRTVDDFSGTDQRPLLPDGESFGNTTTDPWFLAGDPLGTLRAVRRTHGGRVELVYFDCPRIETNAADFEAADPQAILDTWLSVTQALLRRAYGLLSDVGVIAVLCGVNELPYVQLLLNESAGPRNYIGTVAWQKGYSPRNMPNMKELSPTHDNIVLFSRRQDSLRAVALRVPPEGFANPDSDPRGPWNAEQKGANKPDCDYEINVCPYRWSIVEGTLPRGVWRINPKTGVIWGPSNEITTPGSWTFTVQAADREGQTAKRRYVLTVSPDSPAPTLASIPWLPTETTTISGRTPKSASSGALRILTKDLPAARQRAEYSACIIATGGSPWTGTTRPGKTTAGGKGRYWEFPITTLLERTARDAVDFKKSDQAIPALKTYLGPAQTVPLNQMTTWFGRAVGDADPLDAGYAQDAKNELESLFEAGVVGEVIRTSKPMNLVARVLALFTRESAFVVDIGSPAAEMAAVATACGRRAVYVELPGDEKRRSKLTLPRLQIAAKGRHPLPAGVAFLVDAGTPTGTSRGRSFIVDGKRRTEDPSAEVCRFDLGPEAVELDRQLGVVSINYTDYPAGSRRFLCALANLEGLFPVRDLRDEWFATSLDGRLRGAYLKSDLFLDDASLEELRQAHATHLSQGGRLRVYFHRGRDDSWGTTEGALETRRIPFSLAVSAEVL